MTTDLADPLDAVADDEYSLLEYAATWDRLDGVAAQLAAAIRVFVITRDPLDWIAGRGSMWVTANADGDTLELPVYVTRAKAGSDMRVLADLARRVLVNAIANQGVILAGSYAALDAGGACALLAEPEASSIELPQMSPRSREWEPLGLGVIQDLVQDAFGPVDFDRASIRLDPVSSPVAGCPACAGVAFGFPAEVTVAAAEMCAPHYEAATAVIDARIARARTSNPAGWRAIGKAAARTSDSPDPDRAPQPPRHQSGPRRNDPCPCGSGRKYKRCCGG